MQRSQKYTKPSFVNLNYKITKADIKSGSTSLSNSIYLTRKRCLCIKEQIFSVGYQMPTFSQITVITILFLLSYLFLNYMSKTYNLCPVFLILLKYETKGFFLLNILKVNLTLRKCLVSTKYLLYLKYYSINYYEQ